MGEDASLKDIYWCLVYKVKGFEHLGSIFLKKKKYQKACYQSRDVSNVLTNDLLHISS